MDLSTSILQLSENGDLQKIHDKWLLHNDCAAKINDDNSNQLSLKSFWGLFLICGIACFLALILFFIKACRQYMKFGPEEDEVVQQPMEISSSRRLSGRIPRRTPSFKDFKKFVDIKEAEVKERLKRNKKRQRGENMDEESNFSP